MLYFIDPHQVLSKAFSRLCPATTIECGLTGDQEGIEHAYLFIKNVLEMSEFSYDNSHFEDIDIYHSMAKK